MKPLSCVATRRRLSAFQDGELTVSEQVAVDVHLRGCSACAAELAGVREIGDLLRSGSAGAGVGPDFDLLEADLLSRLSAEREESMSAQMSRAFQDMRLGFAAVGSTVATLVSILLVIGIFSWAPLSAHPDSLAGMMESLGTPAIGTDSRILSPRSSDSGSLTEGLVNEGDEVLTLAALITRNGRIASLEYRSEQSSDSDRTRATRLLDEISRRRFEPARMGGTAVAVKTVLAFTRTTVRAKMPVTPKQSSMSRGLELIRS